MTLKFKLLAAFGSVILTGCAVGPDFHSPKPPATLSYTECPLPKKTATAHVKGGNAQCFILGMDLPGQWWELFHSPQLNELIKDGIAHNPDMHAAQAALRQAHENFKAEFGNLLLPAVDASGYVQRQRFTTTVFGAQPGEAIDQGTTFNLANVSVNVSYNLDVFGGSRRQVESQIALVDYQRYQLIGTYITLTSNIVTTAINIASICKQIAATQALIESDEKLLVIMRQQFGLGAIAQGDILTQETLVAQTRATLPPLLKSLAQAKHALSVLVGALPSEAAIPDIDLDSLHLPSHLPLSLPSLLVRQRPDVQAAEALMHQANALVGVATADMLPKFPLTANYGWINDSIHGLISPSNVVWSIMAQFTQPIFHGGALKAKRRAAKAAYKQAFAKYRITVLQAFQNVADSLRAIETDAKALRAQTLAETSACRARNLIQQQFRLGAVSYINLLNAERQYQQAHIARIQAQAQRYADTAALFQSLGGGWWHMPPEVIGMVGKK